MRALKVCLWIPGILFLLSVFVMFFPVSAFESIAKVFGIEGIESLPDCPLVLYAIRTAAATFVVVGVFSVILALDPMSYGIMVPFSGLGWVFMSVVCAITGPIVGMPLLLFLGDSLSCLVLGVLILVFWRQAKQTSG